MATEPAKTSGDPWAPPEANKVQPRTEPVPPAQAVKITAIDIPFWSLVRFGVKLAVAAVPALLVLLLVLVAIVSLAGALLGTAIVAALTELLSGLAQSVSWPW
ncbi:MAG: hypothetical protein ACRBC3_10495 [Burkholderiaceae bacterium]